RRRCLATPLRPARHEGRAGRRLSPPSSDCEKPAVKQKFKGVARGWGAAVSACGGKANAPGVNPERQSDVEYAIARDYFEKGQPRLALDHCRKAVELNDQNARALYFTSAVYLFFCNGKLGFSDLDCHVSDAEKYARSTLKVDEH